MRQPALHDILCNIIGDSCYFSPPAGFLMNYPCIVYNYANSLDSFADNIHYKKSKRYIVTVIDEDPDSKIPNKLEELPYCTADRNFVVDGLNHFVYTLFYSGPRMKEE